MENLPNKIIYTVFHVQFFRESEKTALGASEGHSSP